MPVVVDARVRPVGGGDDRALLRARCVLDIAAGVVTSLARRQDLASGERFLDEPGVVSRPDDLNPLRASEPGPVPYALTLGFFSPASSRLVSRSPVGSDSYATTGPPQGPLRGRSAAGGTRLTL